MFDWVLNSPSGSLDTCEMLPINDFIFQYLCHNQFVFCFGKWKHYIEKHLIANFIYEHHFLI